MKDEIKELNKQEFAAWAATYGRGWQHWLLTWLYKRAVDYIVGCKDIVKQSSAVQSTDQSISVLDIGCGPAGMLVELRKRLPNARLVGLDLIEEMIAVARQRVVGANIELVVGDAEALPFADNTFTVVSILDALHHLPDIDLAILEFKRVLRPGGRLIIFDPENSGWCKRLLIKFVTRIIGEGYVVVRPRVEVESKLRAQGFVVENSHAAALFFQWYIARKN